jgi:hypothetical protein
MYFKHFNLDILEGIDASAIPYTTESVIDDYKNIIIYYPLVDNELKEELRSKFPIPPDQISMCFCSKEMPPHKDHLPHNVCMNYYIKTANCTTQYYEKKTKEEMAALGNLGALARPLTLQSNYMSQQESENIFWKAALKRTDSFVAKDNEYWLLNVRQIHNVIFNDPAEKGPRQFLVFAWWTKEFDEIAAMLEQMSVDNTANT